PVTLTLKCTKMRAARNFPDIKLTLKEVQMPNKGEATLAVAPYQSELFWSSTALRETSNRILHVCCITNLPHADGAEPRTATLLDLSSSIGSQLRNGAIRRNESGVRC